MICSPTDYVWSAMFFSFDTSDEFFSFDTSDGTVTRTQAGQILRAIADVLDRGSGPAISERQPMASRRPGVDQRIRPEAETVVEPEYGPGDGDEPASALPTLDDALAIATRYVTGGNAAAVRAALAKVGAARTSALTPDQITPFITALNESGE